MSTDPLFDWPPQQRRVTLHATTAGDANPPRPDPTIKVRAAVAAQLQTYIGVSVEQLVDGSLLVMLPDGQRVRIRFEANP